MSRVLDFVISFMLGVEIVLVGLHREWHLGALIILCVCTGIIYRSIVNYYDWKEGQE